MKRAYALAAVSLAVMGASCEPRYELVASGSDTGAIMYRLNRESGEVCAFMLLPNPPPVHLAKLGDCLQ